jgi:hypothetical protein
MMDSVTLNLGSAVYSVSLSQPNAPVAAAPAAMLMPEPDLGGDVGFIIAKMVIDNAFTNRMQARHDRQRANEVMVASQKEQISHMREAAEKRYLAGTLEAWGKIGEGAYGIAGGATMAAGSEGGGKIACSFGSIASGTTSLVAQGSRHAGDELDADAKAAENAASQQRRLIETADEDIKEARDYTRAAIDFLREFQSTETKSLSSAIRG